MTVHTGTHIDAPDHFLDNGQSVDGIPLSALIGPARVVELPSGMDITADMLQQANIPSPAKRLLFKTRNSQLWKEGVSEFQTDFMAVDEEAAEYLVSRDVEVVGVDYLSVAPYRAPVETHEILLRDKVLIIEGLNLSGVEPGEYTLYCLPLNISGAEGAPARVLLGR
jgi:arylformamidase